MNKKQVLATLALSTIALAQAGYVSADELAPIDSSAPTTEVVTPTVPSASTETEAPAVQPTEPSVTPVDPTTPDTSSTTDKGEPAIQPELSEAVVSDKGEPAIQPELSEAVVSDKGEPAIQPELSEAVVTNKGTPEVQAELPKAELPKAELPKTTVEANEQGKSQIGTTSTSTGQVVHDVTKEPVETNTGASIVNTQGGNVVLSDGSVVAPEEVGGTVNEDKTISVTDKEGKLKTLPNTGTAESILSAIGGMLMTAVGYFYKKKLF
ncbi:LPXTG cell wall anchor domain-containing protein [Streptococcus pneumoniae]